MSGSDPLFHRRSIRLRGWDYSREGAYFITICTRNHELLLGRIENECMEPSQIGSFVISEWAQTFKIRRNFEADYSVVMPNHFHGIVVITEKVIKHDVGATCGRPDPNIRRVIRQFGPTNASLASAIAGFKSAVTSKSRKLLSSPALQVWQRNYHEHIIRNEDELFRCREYIENNPLKWTLDRYYRSAEELGL
jgi:putative transposase